MTAGIRAPNLPLRTDLSEFIGIQTEGSQKSLGRFTRASVIGSIEAVANSFTVGGGVIFTTLSQALANLNYNANQMAWVIQDTMPANNGVYQKTGASGSGSWARRGNLPYAFYRAQNEGAGTPNAIQATNGYPLANKDAIIVVNITDTTTDSPVTISFNGETPLAVKTSSGNDPAPGGLVAGMVMAGYIDASGTQFRLLSDQASAAIVPAAENAQAAAEAAKDDAQNAADAAISATGIALFATKSAAEASTLPASTKHLSLAGYSTPGAGPWRVAARVASEPSHGAKLRSVDRYLPNGSVDSTNGGWWELKDTEVSFLAFGPAADGATDDTSTLNGAVDYISAVGGKLIIPPGDYAVSDAVLKSNMHLEFMPGARFVQGSLGTSASSVLYGSGTVGTGVALSSNVSSGQVSVSVASGGAAFAAGSFVLVYDDDYVFPGGSPAGRNQEVMRVLSSDATTITFTAPLTTAFTTANNAEIAPLAPLEDLTISGPGEVVVGSGKAFGIRFRYPVNCRIEDGVISRNPRAGGAFVFQTGYNSHIYRCSAFDGQVQTSGLGYAVAFDESCTYCTASYCHFENVRENTFTNRTRWCEFSHNICVDIADSGWNCHGAGSDHNSCRDNTFKHCSQGVAVGWSGATRADNHNCVENNRFFKCENAISFNNDTGLTSLGNMAKGNVIENCSTNGVLINRQDSAVVTGNVIHDTSGASFTGVYAVGNTTSCMITDNKVFNLTGASAVGIRADGAIDMTISGNAVRSMSGGSAVPFYVPTGTDVRVHFNSAYDAPAVSLAGATSNTLNSWN